MTDEMRIQQQTSSTPYLLGGLGVGAVGGYGLSRIDSIKNWASDPATLERLKEIGEKPDTVELSTKQKATLDSLKAKLEELKAAEAELETAKKAVPVDENIKTNWTNAEKEYNAEFKRLIEEETNKANGKARNFVEVKPWGELTPEQVSALKGKNITDIETKYNKAQQAYAQAIADAQASTGTKYEAVNKEFNTIKQALEDAYSTTAKMADNAKDPNRVFAQKKKGNFFQSIRTALGLSGDKSAYANFEEAARQINPQVSELTNEQKKALGEFVAETDLKKLPKPKHTEEIVQIKNAKGELEGYVKVAKGTEKQALADLNKTIIEEQKKLADELFGNAKKYWELDTKIKNFDTNFKVNDKALKKAGLTDLTGLETASKYEGYIKELKSIKAGIAPNTTQEAAMKAISTTETDIGKLIGFAQKRMEIAKAKANELEALKKQFNAIVGQDSRMLEVTSRLETTLRREKGVKDAFKELRKQFPELFPAGTTEAAVDEAKIKEIVEEKIKGLKAGKDYEAAKTVYEKAVAEGKTKIDDAAKELAQGKVDKCKGELEKMGKEFCSTSKGKLALVIGGTAVAGALLAMALKPKNN